MNHLVIWFFLVTFFVLLLYPFAAWLRAVFFPKPVRKNYDSVQPVSIIIACRNEESSIGQKLDSFLCREEWIEGSELIVISNGSTDSTNKILGRYENDPRVQLIMEPEQSSKIISVNRGVERSRHPLLLFSDCRQTMKKGSVKALISNFGDPEVGTVNSTLVDSATGFSFRSVLNFIADSESKSGSSLNVFGALYAQRRSVFRKVPEDLLFDDLFVVVSTLSQGKRLVAEKNAVIYDVAFEKYYRHNRIQRLARGLLIFLVNHFGLIRKLRPTTFFRFIVFKYLKLVLPFMIVACCADFIYGCMASGIGEVDWFCVASFAFLYLLSPVRHLITVNYNFMIATIAFIFFKNRSNKWDKLTMPEPVRDLL